MLLVAFVVCCATLEAASVCTKASCNCPNLALARENKPQVKAIRYRSQSMLQVNHDVARRILHLQEAGTQNHEAGTIMSDISSLIYEAGAGTSIVNQTFPQFQGGKIQMSHSKEGRSASTKSQRTVEQTRPEYIIQLAKHDSPVQIGQVVSLALARMDVFRSQGMEVGLVSVIIVILSVVACLGWALSANKDVASESSTGNAFEPSNDREKEYWKSCERIVPLSQGSYPHSRVASTTRTKYQKGRDAHPPVRSSQGPTPLQYRPEESGVGRAFDTPSQSSTYDPYSEFVSSTAQDVASSHALYSAARVPSSGPSTQPLLPSGHSLKVPQISSDHLDVPVSEAYVNDHEAIHEVLDQTKVVVRTRGRAAGSSVDVTESDFEAVSAQRQRLVEFTGRVAASGSEMTESELQAVLAERQRLVEASGSRRQLYESPRGMKSAAQGGGGAGELGSLLQQRQKAVEATSSQREMYLSPRRQKAAAPPSRTGELEKIFAKRRPDN